MKRFLLFVAALVAANAFAGNVAFSSGPDRTDLVELFTSEGCSSCPPAEHTINILLEDNALWKNTIPIVFHVTYWDYLGWKDRFARSEFNVRQRQYAQEWNTPSIYTPSFVVNGLSARNPADKITDHESAGMLNAEVTNGQVRVHFKPAAPTTEKRVAWIAPLSLYRQSQVTAGENKGQLLTHRFTALRLWHQLMSTDVTGYTTTFTTPLPNGSEALAVWVSSTNSIAPLQATGGPLDY